MSLDRFTSSFVVRDNWRELNLHHLDVTMGQKGMQKELRKRFGIDGGYTNSDLRRTTLYGAHPHIQASFECLPFPDNTFTLILYDPPFLVDRRSISGHDYRRRYFKDYTVQEKSGYAGTPGNIGQKFGAWPTRPALRKQLFRSFTELKRILHPDGQIIFKWTDSDASLKWALSLKNGLEVERVFSRKSGGGKTKKTYYVWLKKPEDKRRC